MVVKYDYQAARDGVMREKWRILFVTAIAITIMGSDLIFKWLDGFGSTLGLLIMLLFVMLPAYSRLSQEVMLLREYAQSMERELSLRSER